MDKVSEREFRADLDKIASLVGRTIVSANHLNSGSTTDDDIGGVTLELDDGRAVMLLGWGHDWWGLQIEIKQPRGEDHGREDPRPDRTRLHESPTEGRSDG